MKNKQYGGMEKEQRGSTQCQASPRRCRPHIDSWFFLHCKFLQRSLEVFPLAVNYPYRYLSHVPTGQAQLQPGAVCMLQATPLTLEKLCLYTDHATCPCQVRQWEVLVPEGDLASRIAEDSLALILHPHSLPSDPQVLVKKHAQTFLALSASDYTFTMCPLSMIATGSIAAALQGPGARCVSGAKLTELRAGIPGTEAPSTPSQAPKTPRGSSNQGPSQTSTPTDVTAIQLQPRQPLEWLLAHKGSLLRGTSSLSPSPGAGPAGSPVCAKALAAQHLRPLPRGH
ncbi:LOW QUALITY PROTEIN: G1/S-specific cyclin-D3-like [Ctenodactylus gundi]